MTYQDEELQFYFFFYIRGGKKYAWKKIESAAYQLINCRYCQSTSPTIRMVNCVLGFIEYYNDSAINEIMKKNVQ